ncbi:FAD-dependent oxidoreductase [Candidatus Gottesmanbacteria bacterium]|nr:FAD-dependent oxidoreductase [Candidatus Gottesmanbacteria bacterium]
MKIAIIGGGVTGLTAGYELTKRGHNVTIFEKEKTLGGLAAGFKQPHWEWYLEGGYHHLFTNDDAIIGLIEELGLGDKLIIRRPTTASYWQGNIYPLDSASSLLRFPGLSVFDRFRTGALLAGLKLNPFWQPLEYVTAYRLFRLLGGKKSWDILWEPLMAGKFGELSQTIAASWFWARIKKRTAQLAYIAGGFHTLVTALEQSIKNYGGTIHTNTTISDIRQENFQFDKVLLTVPTPIAAKLVPGLVLNIPHLHAQTLILETKEPILNDVYWLNITDRSFPFLAVVAHTNFMDKKYYGGHHITYFGNYLPTGHPYLSMTKEQLLKKFDLFIKKLNPTYHLSRITCHLFNGPFAQPVHQLHYSHIAPKLETPIPNVYLANLDSIYPWDRGTNYAVELGKRAALAMI